MALLLVCWGQVQAAQPAWAGAGGLPTRGRLEEIDPEADFTQLSLEELGQVRVRTVYGASRYIQKSSIAPGAVTVVEADEIAMYGYRSLDEILKSINGLYVSYDRDYAYLGLRGFNRPGDYNSRVLLLVDGHRMNDPVYGGAPVGRDFPVDVDLIDRVEVVRGPSFSAFGDNAVFGVINVITKTARDFNNGEVSMAGGNWNAYQGRFSFGHRLSNDVAFLVSGTVYDSHGRENLYFPEYDQPEHHNGIATGADYERFYNFLGKIAYHEFSLEGVYGSREKGIPTGVYGTTFNDPSTRTVDEVAFLEGRYHPRFEAQDLELDARLYFDHYAGDGFWSYDRMNLDYGVGDAWGASAQLTQKIQERHTISVGADLRDCFNQHLDSWWEDPYEPISETRQHSINGGIFGLAEAQLLTNLTVNAGLRYDYFSQFSDSVNPRAGLVVQPWRATTLKFLYGSAFRTPNVFELYYHDATPILANPALQPETIHNYQFGWEQGLGRGLRLDASVFYYDFDRVIDQVQEPEGLIYRNRGHALAEGVEWGFEGRFEGGWQTRLGYTFQRTEDQMSGDELSNSPRHLVKANLIAPLYRQTLFTGLELQYNGAVWSALGERVSDYWVMNWTLYGRRLLKNLDASVSVYNLFDQKYASPGTDQLAPLRVVPQDGISFRVKLTYRF